MSDKEANEIRLVANEIIRRLHESRKLSQVQLLHMLTSLSLRDLDPEGYKESIINSFRTLSSP